MANPPPHVVRETSTVQHGHDGRDGSGRDQIRGGVGRVDREVVWVVASRSKLWELEHAGPVIEQESHGSRPRLWTWGPRVLHRGNTECGTNAGLHVQDE